MERSNRATVERLGRVGVSGLPRTTPDGLAEAGAALPLERLALSSADGHGGRDATPRPTTA